MHKCLPSSGCTALDNIRKQKSRGWFAPHGSQAKPHRKGRNGSYQEVQDRVSETLIVMPETHLDRMPQKQGNADLPCVWWWSSGRLATATWASTSSDCLQERQTLSSLDSSQIGRYVCPSSLVEAKNMTSQYLKNAIGMMTCLQSASEKLKQEDYEFQAILCKLSRLYFKRQNNEAKQTRSISRIEDVIKR